MGKRTIRKVLQIDGMTCSSCEMRIENKLKKMKGVFAAKAIYSSSNAFVTYDANVIELDTIIEAIEKLDYKVKNCSFGQAFANRNETWKTSGDRMPVKQVLGIGIIILALYVIINNTIGFNFIPQVNQNMGYGILFVVGLITSLHCMAMCGGINLSQCVSNKYGEDETSRFSRLKPSFMYNSGRVVSYTIIGGIVGALGSAVSFSGAAKGVVAIASGIFMMIMGLNMLNIFPWLRKLNPRMPKIHGNKNHSNNRKHGPFYVGLLNGLMPCGPLQAMQLYALGTGSFFTGALSMFIFSLGTVPLMFGFGAISSFLSSKFTHKMMKVSAVLVMVLGFIMVNRGLILSGFNVAFAASGSGNVAKIEGSIQKVTTKLESDKYASIIIQKGIPVKWIIKAEKGSLNRCNNKILIPEYNIENLVLVPGNNVIEFTPGKEGRFTYSCWMGMITGSIRVVADVNNISKKEILDSGSAAVPEKGSIPAEEVAIGKIEGGKQYVSIDVNIDRFSPSIVVLQAGIETKWVLNGKELDINNRTLVFPEYNTRIDLVEGVNKLRLIPVGNFSFQSLSGKLNGYVKVVNDLKKINIDDIKSEVKNFTNAIKNHD